MPISRNNIIKIIFGILSVIIVFLAPYGYHIDLGAGINSIPAMLWEYSSYYSFRYITPLQYYVEFYIFRLVVFFCIIGFLQEKISRKIGVIMGIIGELIVLIISIPRWFILNSDGDNLYPIIIPIPILLIFIIVLVYLFPSIQEKENIGKS